ncbi:MAG TPA: inorganic diphosphatase [Methylomirabilota bacterium]|jgi:inorganic pyrophosphatase|nr:inorganic diphosphatase [Methylomirabilota bacterium]
MVDDKGPDDKVIAIHLDDPEYAHFRHISELTGRRRDELERFFLDCKRLENKAVSIEDMKGSVQAQRAIREAARLYQEKIRPSMDDGAHAARAGA